MIVSVDDFLVARNPDGDAVSPKGRIPASVRAAFDAAR
jgi:hypothetical protein